MQEPPIHFFREIVPSAAVSGHLDVFTWLLEYKSKIKNKTIAYTALHLLDQRFAAQLQKIMGMLFNGF